MKHLMMTVVTVLTLGATMPMVKVDAYQVASAIKEASSSVVEAIEKIKGASVEVALGNVTLIGNIEVSST